MTGKYILKYVLLILIHLNICYYITGCSGITVDKRITVSPDDWLMAGGSPQQQNVSKFILAPPLNLMWDYNLEGGVGPSGITASDAVVFVNALQGELFTFDVNTGGKIGNLKFLGKDCSTAPLILGNDVIFTFAGDKKYSIASYNLVSGEINWRKNYGDIQTSPILHEGFVYFSNLNGSFYKIESASGKIVWKYNTKSPVHSTCSVSGNTAVLGNDKGSIMGIDITAGTEKWKVETGLPVISTPLIYEGNAYLGCDDSNYYSIELETGKVNWKVNLHTKMIAGSAIDGNGNIVTGCVDGSIYSLNLLSGEVSWKAVTYGAVVSSPVVSGNYIYVSSYDSYIYSLDALTGKVLWKSMLENKVKTSPVVWKEYLFVAADEMLYCFTSRNVEKKF
ncbi:MAG TPA: PQQ-binding-like beta-propeller repeat protein [Ignavibacteria bacterium]|nr:PQQ-binding-like beta-propeller repeat protein [Ignavibacteria bacterium]HRF64714.1 PQQ-binding-like beta-propeller repeat protein [Ignavibacteria bacterium]HRJ03579.1 PQQ-binding-like beta-propeller repeat protein [Ignavibacteria bacterium]HRJ84164.1 PQQ-binding-like beta-propeller repeat protein [Ignavibacteria bacterium]